MINLHKQIFDRLKITITIIAIVVAIMYFFRGNLIQFYFMLDWYFTVFLVTSLNEFSLGNVEMGLLTLAIQLVAWFMAGIFFKVTIIDTFYPRFRVVTANKDVYRFARKICRTTGDDPNYIYFMVKFHLRPVLRWHKMKLPRPEYVMTGIPFISRTKKYIDNGIKGITWRRMPAHIDILTNDMHLNFNDEEQCYQLGLKLEIYRPDDVTQYEELAFNEVKTIGSNVIESVKGDYGLIKDQYHMGIVIREKNLPIPDEEPDKENKPDSIKKDDKKNIDNKVVYNGRSGKGG